MCGPLSRTSPSSAIRISEPGIAKPTLPSLWRSTVWVVETVEVSVMP